MLKRLGQYFISVLLILTSSLAVAGTSDSKSSDRIVEKRIMGWVENVYFPPTYTKLKAKLDTGAKTSSIDARDITPFEKDGEKWVRFTINRPGKAAFVDKDGRHHSAKPGVDMTFEKPVERVVRIKRHKRKSMERYVVHIPIYIGGREHQAEFSLTNRHKFIYPVLLGRRFLKEVAIVDPGKTFLASVPPPSPDDNKKATLADTQPQKSE
ncbi:MAG: ATP-dependent zinc protease [Ketobacteraceae bacterium]|nr:ATP-dependent zinc protease [Ketobacteraceae bacterium]